MFSFFSKYEGITVEFPETQCFGLRVLTNLSTSAKLCPELWQKFMPMMEDFAKDGFCVNESYGVSEMTDIENFNYRTLITLPEGRSAPEGTEPFTIPGGMYVKFGLPKLEKIAQCYGFIMHKWYPKNKNRADFSRHIFEFYDKDFSKKGNLYILFPVKE